MIYKIYIDDSGSKDYINTFSQIHVDNPPPFDETNKLFWFNNYFVLCGIKINEIYQAEIDRQFNELKIKYFNTKAVEIKSVWLRNPEKRNKHYIIPFKLKENALRGFGEEYFSLISDLHKQIRIISVIFDKHYYKYRNTPESNPLFKTAQVLLERISLQSKQQDSNYVVFDQMENDLSIKKGMHGKLLELSQNRIIKKQIYINKYNFTDISFESSAKSNFLQIADMCAYAINRQFMEHGREWIGLGSANPNKLPLYKFFRIIACNFCRSPFDKSQARGYGICLIPDPKKSRWNFSQVCRHKKTSH